MLFALNIVMAAIAVVLLLTGNVGIGLILLVVFAIVALRLGRKDGTRVHMDEPVVVVAPPPAATQIAPPPADHADSIARLADLRDKGAITPAEFEAKKVELLARI